MGADIMEELIMEVRAGLRIIPEEQLGKRLALLCDDEGGELQPVPS